MLIAVRHSLSIGGLQLSVILKAKGLESKMQSTLRTTQRDISGVLGVQGVKEGASAVAFSAGNLSALTLRATSMKSYRSCPSAVSGIVGKILIR